MLIAGDRRRRGRKRTKSLAGMGLGLIRLGRRNEREMLRDSNTRNFCMNLESLLPIQFRLLIYTLACFVFVTGCQKEREVSRMTIDGLGDLILFMDGRFDSNPGLYAGVFRSGEWLVPKTFVGVFDSRVRYEVIRDGGNVVGMVASDDLNGVLFLFDLKTADCWPFRNDSESAEAVRERGGKLLEKLQETTGIRSLFLRE